LPAGSLGRAHFDLWAANYRWLREAGVAQIEVSEICTACHNDEFFSYRAGARHTGHFAVVAGLREGA
jgi:copper oxidase (laccase) domain-containing protein